MKRFTALLLSAILLCSCAGGLAAQNSEESGQGALYVSVSGEVESFRMDVNSTPIATEKMEAGGTYKVDLSACALDGVNTLQVSNISPAGLQKAVSVAITYPEVLEGTLEEAGIAPQTMDLISDLIESDIANGFTSAQLAEKRCDHRITSHYAV